MNKTFGNVLAKTEFKLILKFKVLSLKNSDRGSLRIQGNKTVPFTMELL